MSVGDELSHFHLPYKSLFCLHFRRVFLLGIEFQVGGYLFFSILQMPVNGIFCLPFSWKVSSQCCCAIKSHTFFPLRAWTFSSCLRHLQSCWNQCVVFIFESMLWFLNQLLPLSLSVSSVAQSCPTLCDPHGLQHSRLPCPSPTPGACSNSCPLSRWCPGLTELDLVL